MSVAAEGNRQPSHLVGLALFFAAFLPFRNLILYHFYVQGAFFWDVGGYAGAIWHRDFWLMRAPMFLPLSLHASHVMLLYAGLTELSWYLPFNRAEFYATILGFGHALPGLGVFWLLTAGLGLRTGRALALAAGLAILFAFNGLALAVVRFPHSEIWVAGSIILMAAAIALGRRRAAIGFLVLALLVREDSGLHIFGLLVTFMALSLWRGGSLADQKFPAALAAAGFLSSVILFVAQWFLFHGANSSLVQTYTGDPPFAHLTLDLLEARFFGLPLYRPYLVLPALVAVIWAVLARNPLIVAGYLAFVPWLVLQLIAANPIPGTLSGYYAFPYLIAVVWPLAAVVWEARVRSIRLQPGRALIGFGLMLAASFVGVENQWKNEAALDLWAGFTTWPSAERIGATDRAVVQLSELRGIPGSPILGDLSIDESIVSLEPFAFPEEDPVDSPAPRPHTDTLAYFEDGPDWVRVKPVIQRAGLDRLYRFEGTSIRLATNRDLDSLAGVRRVDGPLPWNDGAALP